MWVACDFAQPLPSSIFITIIAFTFVVVFLFVFTSSNAISIKVYWSLLLLLFFILKNIYHLQICILSRSVIVIIFFSPYQQQL